MTEDFNTQNSTLPELPAPIKEYIDKYRKLAAVLLIFFFVAALVSGSWQVMILAVIAVPYCLINGLMTERRWRTGYIREVPAVCTSSQFSLLDLKRKTLKVAFRSADDESEFYQFTIRDKKIFDSFIEDEPYIIYVDREQPDTLIGFIQV